LFVFSSNFSSSSNFQKYCDFCDFLLIICEHENQMTIKNAHWIFVKMNIFHTIWMQAETQDELSAIIEVHNQGCPIN
jgi:hypothetical protein